MNITDTFTIGRLRRLSVFAVQLALMGGLTACTESPFANSDDQKSDAQSSKGTTANAGLLPEDGSNSVQIAKSDEIAAIETESSASPDLGTAKPVVVPVIVNPLAVVPTPEPAQESDASVTESDRDNEALTTDNEVTAVDTTDVSDVSDVTTSEAIDETDSESEVMDAATADSDTADYAIPESKTTVETADENNETGVAVDSQSQIAAESKTESRTFFSSHTTSGFTGEIKDDTIHVTWSVDPGALGYNVYRAGKYVTTVWDTNYIETDLFDQDYYYEIQAFDDTKTIYYYVATGLTVSVRTTGRSDPAKPKANPFLLQDYELIFSDEFNGTSLDTSKWNTSLLWGDEIIINGEVQYYVDINKEPDFGFNPFTFDGEHLTINSIETPSELSDKALGQPYLSGVITSYDALHFIYGYAETRAKVTHGRGYWPAFWLLNAYYGQGGDDPEIDIMEFIGHDQDVVYHTYHYYDADGKLRSTESQPTPGIDYTSDFHTFAVEWKPGTIIYYVDGVEVHRVLDPKVSQQSMYVIANTAMGGWWAGDPDETTPFPGEYIIDYIRVYQKTTPYDDVLFNDDMTGVPYADDIPGQAIPNHRPTPEQWPAGYPHR